MINSKEQEDLAAQQFMKDHGEPKGLRPARNKEHDYYVVAAFSLKCRHCGIIKDILFSEPKFRNVAGKDKTSEPECIQLK